MGLRPNQPGVRAPPAPPAPPAILHKHRQVSGARQAPPPPLPAPPLPIQKVATHKVLPERQGRNLAVTVLCVPCSLDSGQSDKVHFELS